MIHLAGRERHRQERATVLDHQVNLAAGAPAAAGLAPLGDPAQDLVGVDRAVVADRAAGRVDKRQAAASAQPRVEKGGPCNHR